MPDDIDSPEIGDEQIDSSGENQNGGEEDNSLSESKKNQSNFKKLAKKAKLVPKLQSEIERLRAELAKRWTGTDSDEDDDDFDFEDDDSDEVFTDVKSELFFIKNSNAQLYKDEMAELLESNPRYKSLSLSDLYDLAKAKFPKSTSKKTIDMSSGRSISASDDISKIDVKTLTAEQIEALPPAIYKKLFLNKK